MWAHSAGEIGKIITRGRRYQGLTQSQLAKAAGVSQKWVSEIEQGKDTAQIGKVMQVLSFLAVRLQVADAPWVPLPQIEPAKPRISLADVIAAHSSAGVKRKKGKR
jgi:y4mF family transcriptional regulator